MGNPFATNVKRLIREQWITQAALAKRLGVTQPAVADCLSHGNPHLSTLRRYKRALGCTWEELLDE